MSTDDIVFGDVRYREPKRLPRPDLDGRWAAIAYELPQPEDMPIFLDLEAADAIERHALRDTSAELGGILLGHECIDEQTGQPFVWVTRSLEARHYENTQASFTYTHDSWEEITRERDLHHADLDIVGWYHTHPDFGIFLSSHDQFLHRHFFGQPLQVAYVIDPIRQTRGFFHWSGDTLQQVGGYHLTARRADRLALARFVNDLEKIPNAGGGPGGLSPRLEAELVAMLSRPMHSPAPADRGMLAALCTLIGVGLGVLVVAAALGLNMLNRQLQDQGRALQTLQASLAKSEEANHQTVATARSQAKEEALDLLLRDLRGGAPPEHFAALFARSQQQLEEARAELKKQSISSAAVYELNQRLQSDVEQSQRKAASLQKDADQAAELTQQLADLKLAEAARLPESALRQRYDYAWYAAAAGWGLSLVLALALSTWYTRHHRPDVITGETPHAIT